MNYEEKRELRLQISQLLADAGLNKATIKEMVETEIKNKVDQAINDSLKHLDATADDNDYIGSMVNRYLKGHGNWYNIDAAVKRELEKRVIKVEFADNVTPVQRTTEAQTENKFIAPDADIIKEQVDNAINKIDSDKNDKKYKYRISDSKDDFSPFISMEQKFDSLEDAVIDLNINLNGNIAYKYMCHSFYLKACRFDNTSVTIAIIQNDPIKGVIVHIRKDVSISGEYIILRLEENYRSNQKEQYKLLLDAIKTNVKKEYLNE